MADLGFIEDLIRAITRRHVGVDQGDDLLQLDRVPLRSHGTIGNQLFPLRVAARAW